MQEALRSGRGLFLVVTARNIPLESQCASATSRQMNNSPTRPAATAFLCSCSSSGLECKARFSDWDVRRCRGAQRFRDGSEGLDSLLTDETVVYPSRKTARLSFYGAVPAMPPVGGGGTCHRPGGVRLDREAICTKGTA